ncbi:MAG TPA: GDSL-type esterase/lipase family protein [Thermoanaerobaculaceae bacterium]|nr:GDSL-type esterase/lipase family protein [Thermoanaerobaculaceae bacterium]HRS14940.1 GDSL-type esterase/lipase family protein [Thermoanaerobaculaceae bacterium]
MTPAVSVWLAAALLALPAADGARPGAPRPTRRPTPAPEPRAVPIENPAALRPFLAALAAPAGAEPAPAPVRVLHFGDSHVAADWWSDELRRVLQRRGGDAGVGLVMPGRPWSHFNHERAKSPKAGWQTLGIGHQLGDGFVGLSGVALAPRSRATAASVIARFSRFEVQIGLPDGQACLELSVDGEPMYSGWIGLESGTPGGEQPGPSVTIDVAPIETAPGSAPPVPGSCRAIAFLRGEVAPGEHVLSIEGACGGSLLVLGGDLRNTTPGVVVDTLGLNGAEMAWLERADPEVRRVLLTRARPSLIIVSYGTNDMTAGDFSAASYLARARRILAAFHRDAPEAAVLVTGPFDRSHRRQARRELVRRRQREITAALREAALAEGCAFWDARAAMGGEGSIAAWRRRGLAAGDLVHLSERGYRLLGGLLAEALLSAGGEARP